MCLAQNTLRKNVVDALYKKHTTDDYQGRNGGSIEPDRPDFIHHTTTDKAVFLMFDFKNTDPDLAMRWVECFAIGKELPYTDITVGPGEDQGILNDWTRVTMRYCE